MAAGAFGQLNIRLVDGTALFIDMTERGALVLASVDLEIGFEALFKGMDSAAGPA